MKDFKTLYDKKSVDIINYIKGYLSSHKDIEILIGCDSQVKGREIGRAHV